MLACISYKSKTNRNGKSSLIFCLDKSGSIILFMKLMENYKKINEIRTSIFVYNITRLDMVKLSITKIINSLLEESPKIKVGLVTFGRDIEVKGDCLSNVIIVKEKDLDNEEKLEWLGKENTNLIQSEINKSSKEVIKYLREIRGDGPTALGPAVLLSLSLLNKLETGSRMNCFMYRWSK